MAAADAAPPAAPGYWDIPEGTDCARKTWLTGRLGAAIGMLGSVYHIVLFPPDTALQGLQRAATTTVTMATIGAVFGVTTCLSAQIRDAPDDPMNYFIGGCMSGSILGARAHSFATGTTACVGLGLAATLTKMGKLEGWRYAGPPRY
ncbi:NADH dehydrogenase [ubiquinone] 1 alpha subcomplex subunit 11 [Hemicordylus capensis]|uniref:NADH dehydrogenase [ubiquinone] 1 alpha subcomplex subunit 11 n=1 Tax=Hemicordylus capensis TaxID=884348 RepID=UPI002302CBC4|nr:NADH dehydrogenase [ubiquinone] 1 alpha subcomplex subunit 11 [Hemicordylus capensis]